MKKLYQILVISVAFMLLSLNAHASLTFEGNAIGSWANPIHDYNDYTRIYNHDVGSNAYFIWGLPYGGYSYFSFDGVGSDSSSGWSTLDDGSAFLLGEFVYRNGVNYAWSADGVKGVDLNMAVNIHDPVSLLVHTYNFDFTIDNTLNTTGNAYRDRDIVNVVMNNSSSTFLYNAEEYTLDILGFSRDGGNTFLTDFATPECCYTFAGIYASIRKTGNAVPEPASLFLFGSGLISLLGFRKKIRK